MPETLWLSPQQQKSVSPTAVEDHSPRRLGKGLSAAVYLQQAARCSVPSTLWLLRSSEVSRVSFKITVQANGGPRRTKGDGLRPRGLSPILCSSETTPSPSPAFESICLSSTRRFIAEKQTQISGGTAHMGRKICICKLEAERFEPEVHEGAERHTC